VARLAASGIRALRLAGQLPAGVIHSARRDGRRPGREQGPAPVGGARRRRALPLARPVRRRRPRRAVGGPAAGAVPPFDRGLLHPLRHELDTRSRVRWSADADPALDVRPAGQQPAHRRGVWKVGYSLKEESGADGVIGRKEIAVAVERLMRRGTAEADDMRRRAKLLRDSSRAAVEVGGSSWRDITSFINLISQ
jgi:hypothetical protein